MTDLPTGSVSFYAAYTLAMRHYTAGRRHESLLALRQALELQPDDAALLNLLATVALQDGDAVTAKTCFERLLRLQSGDFGACLQLGTMAEAAGFPEPAETALRRALALVPDSADAHYLLGALLLRGKRGEEAVAAYRRTIELAPRFVDAYLGLGNALALLGRDGEATTLFEQALRLHPDHPETLAGLAGFLKTGQRRGEAEHLYRQALQLRPDFIECHHRLGALLMEDGRWSEAETALREAVRLNPRAVDIVNDWGILMMKAGRAAEAEAAFHETLRLKPDFVHAKHNLSLLLKDFGRVDEAEQLCREALRIDPDMPAAHNQWGVLTMETGRLEAAETAFRKTLELRPEDQEAAWNLAILHLLRGEFEPGWRGYERRWETAVKAGRRDFAPPMWDGHPFPGRTLLLHCEQGLGDSLQFARYLPRVAALGGRLLLECQPPLCRLFEALAGIEQIIPAGAALPPFDLHCPLLSLPLLFGTRLENIPAETPYLSVPAGARAAAPRLEARPDAPLKVGLAWAGNPEHKNDINRSLRLEWLAPWFNLPGISWVILQKERRPQGFEAQAARRGWLDPMTGVRDLADTAAIVEQLDLVVAVDTALIHLAGALGVATWTLIPYNPDWRWMMEREDSPWYPGMRLFRQQQRNAWPEVIEKVGTALAALTGNGTAPQAVLEVTPLLPPATAPTSALRPIYQLPAYQRLLETKHGLFLYNANDVYIGRMLEVYGEYCEHEAALFRQLLRPGDTVIEAGANIGALTVPLAKAVGPGGAVLAFEPQPVVFHTLCANLALNALENVRAFPYALGRWNGNVFMPKVDYAVTDNFGGLSLRSTGTAGSGNPLTVAMVKLDEFCKDTLPRFIKIDVEGMESEVLAGAAELIRRARPLLYVENDRQERSPMLVGLLRKMGYRLYWHTPPLFNPNNHFGYPGNIYGATATFNMLGIPAENPLTVRGLTEVGADGEHPLL